MLDQSLSALGLKQHVSEYTHKDGNILDVIITELDNTYTHSCEVRDFLSDHCYVLFKSTRCKDKIEHHKVEHRNIKCVTQSTWREKLSNISIIDNCCITEQAKAFENDLTKLLNEVAPIKNKIVRKRTPSEYTHKDGNILDVIITELDNTYTHSCEVRDFLSDHCYVLFKSTRCKDKIEHHKVEHRNIKCVTQSTWREKLSNISIIDNCCITEQAKAFENDLTKLLNEVAPIKNKIVRKRTPNPWFSDNVKAARLTYRRCVKSWVKSLSEDKCRAVKKSRHEYCKQLKHAKKSFFTEKVLSSKGNVKGLCNTINGLIKREKENPMPTNRSNHDLAQHFADFFSNKVSKIAEALKQYPDFVPPERQVTKLESFDVVSDDDIISIMTKLGNKQCELDLFPVNILNEHKVSIVKEITKLVNSSLQSGSFPENWKKSSSKALDKKTIRRSNRYKLQTSFKSKVPSQNC